MHALVVAVLVVAVEVLRQLLRLIPCHGLTLHLWRHNYLRQNNLPTATILLRVYYRRLLEVRHMQGIRVTFLVGTVKGMLPVAGTVVVGGWRVAETRLHVFGGSII